MQQLTSLHFARHFRDIVNNNKDERFCLILGSGASRSSGIPTGAELASKWLAELKDNFWTMSLKRWARDRGITSENAGEFYAEIFQKRFKIHTQQGYAELNKTMEKVTPAFGYSVLAQLMGNKYGNVVITTNFDNLVEEALFSFSSIRPLVCGHEYLAPFASLSDTRPLVIKIHRDRQLNPLNKVEEISRLKPEWIQVLNIIFSHCIPVFIGYGGNDGSLMNYLNQIPKFRNLFWCDFNKDRLQPSVVKFIKKSKGFFVKIDGFDELMFDLFSELKYPLLDIELKDATAKRAEDYIKSINGIRASKMRSVLPEDQANAKELSEKVKKDWISYYHKIEETPNFSKKRTLFRKGLKEFPNSHELMTEYAEYLKGQEDYQNAEIYFKKALKLCAVDPVLNNGYATFLHEIKKDYDNAEVFYKLAIDLKPEYSRYHFDYAKFVDEIEKDYKLAEKHYRISFDIQPEVSDYYSTYAIFLSKKKNDSLNAEKYFKKAIKIEPKNDFNIAAYANFLSDIKKDNNAAEKYFTEALSINSKNDNCLADYAFFLENNKKDLVSAEKYYRKAIKVGPKNPLANGYYGTFLLTIKKNYALAKQLLEKSLKHDPDNANINSNYAKVLIIQKKPQRAKKFIEKAFKCKNIDSDIEAELYFYLAAHFFSDFNKAKRRLRKLIKAGARSIGWNLDDNIAQAEQENHPEILFLRLTADILTKNGTVPSNYYRM